MTVLIIIITIIIIGVVVFELIAEHKAKKEIENMTAENFEKKYRLLAEKGNQLEIAQFLKRHILFIIKNQDEVKAILLKYQIKQEGTQNDKRDN